MRPAARGDQLRPLVGQRLDLAVAVELVAEEVAEHDQRGVELRRRPAAARPRRPRRGPRSPRCSSSAVATPQVMFEPARLWTGVAAVGREDRGDHPRRRRLAVGGADDRRAARRGRAPSRAIASGCEPQQDPARAGWCRRRGRWRGWRRRSPAASASLAPNRAAAGRVRRRAQARPGGTSTLQRARQHPQRGRKVGRGARRRRRPGRAGWRSARAAGRGRRAPRPPRRGCP